jgi:serine acetyltransferase
LLPASGERASIARILLLPIYQQTRVLLLVRLATEGAHWIRPVARFLLRALHSIEAGESLHIGRALRLPHPQCIILGDGVRIGDDVSIAQFVTIGGNFRKSRRRVDFIQQLPIVGSRVVIGPGAVVGGPVTIGDDVVIGANAVITKDIPSNRLAYGLSQVSTRRIVVDPTGGYSELDGTADPGRRAIE